MRALKISAIVVFGLAALGSIVYLLGPKPAPPSLKYTPVQLPTDLVVLEQQIIESENSEPGIKEGCRAEIVWADSARKEKTKRVILYLHGGTSSHMDADPVHRNLAKKLNANLYLTRLPGHGVDLGDATLANVTADDFLYAAEHAYAIASSLGDEVIVMGSSFGGALAIYLASQHPEIKGLVLYSPCVKTYDERMEMFIKPWGLWMVKKAMGSETFDMEAPIATYSKYWTAHYSLNFLAAFQNALEHTMTPETFTRVTCPVFMGYWYKNDAEQDRVASIPAMLKMYEQLGSSLKEKHAFSNAGNHAIACPLLAENVVEVQKESERFLERIR